MGKRLRKATERRLNRIIGYDQAVAIAKQKAKAFIPESLRRPGSEKKRKGR